MLRIIQSVFIGKTVDAGLDADIDPIA